HYYGGIKKFHWVARPLALHGTAIKEDGRKVNIVLGEDTRDPVLTINDLLPHLALKVQGNKKLSEAIPAEKLNILVGGLPLHSPDDASSAVKMGILKILREKYGLVEEDLISAELEIVPAGKARDVGLDRAFVGAYGHDDRICAYSSLSAILRLKKPDTTGIALFLDKEEIGSDGNTGAKSRFMDMVIYDLMRLQGINPEPDSLLRIYMKSRAISADVTAGIDPDYMDVHEKRNDAMIGYGVCLTKYTGARGKYSANDAHAEYVNWLRRIWNHSGVIWQAGELGKVDQGGGGTVAKYLAEKGMDTVDAGTPLLSMHSPFEIAHKADLLMTFRAYSAFYTGGYQAGH
ncbi:MAG TPA: aminopeptidase, partial [Thermodesulfobacteriaceae bacterium]|nr:aminopeptidase [Thermodesulfobacteriaceae bacterium]